MGAPRFSPYRDCSSLPLKPSTYWLAFSSPQVAEGLSKGSLPTSDDYSTHTAIHTSLSELHNCAAATVGRFDLPAQRMPYRLSPSKPPGILAWRASPIYRQTHPGFRDPAVERCATPAIRNEPRNGTSGTFRPHRSGRSVSAGVLPARSMEVDCGGSAGAGSGPRGMGASHKATA